MHHCRSVLLHQINVKIDHIFNDLSQRFKGAVTRCDFASDLISTKSRRVTTYYVESQYQSLSESRLKIWSALIFNRFSGENRDVTLIFSIQ